MGVKGRDFVILAAQNAPLIEWDRTVAGNRVHGITLGQAAQQFRKVEQAILRTLPACVFLVFSEPRRTNKPITPQARVDSRTSGTNQANFRCRKPTYIERCVVELQLLLSEGRQ